MEYRNLKINGQLFSIWILRNYKKFKLDDIIKKTCDEPHKIKKTN